MGQEMESNSDRTCTIGDSPNTVLPPHPPRSGTRRRNSQSKPVRRDDLLSLNEGYLEIDFSRYRSASCKAVPSRISGAKIELKRTSVYQSSKELRRMKNPGNIERRRKIEISRSSDTNSRLSIMDSLCGSDEDNRGKNRNMEESERDMNKDMKFRCDEIVSRVNGGNGIRQSLLEIPDSPSTWESGRPSGKVRFSSIRKMFDPLMKSKSLRNPPSVYSVEKEKNPRSNAPLINEPETSPVHLRGVLKFGDRNGLPLFEFSRNRSEDVFVAKARKKDEAFESLYTFHCFNGRKRSDSESTLVGKMQVSFHIDSEVRFSGGFQSSLVMESVLYGNGDRDSSNIEIAAIVIRVPYGIKESKSNANLSLFKMISKGKQRPIKEELHRENVNVIVPTGHHGLPETESGGPSSLLERWRGGGGCDCGGWDMGCPLTVFGNMNLQCCEHGRLFKNTNQRPLELFVQGAKDKTPALTMKLIEEGHYSVDFHARLSSLQAFSICVSMLHGAKTRSAFEKESKELMQCSSLKMLIEEEVNCLLEAVTEEKKLPKKVEENPPSYVLNPPFSPIARV